MENIGQFTDQGGNPVPGVFFKGSSPGMDVYITNKGITYVFLKFEEEEERGASTQPDEEEQGQDEQQMPHDVCGRQLLRQQMVFEPLVDV